MPRALFLLLLLVIASTLGHASLDKDWRSSLLADDDRIDFGASKLSRTGLYNPHFWVENNERSTSKNYRWWKESDVYLVEWPGNITARDPKWPLLKWNKPRAKFLVNRCCEYYAGIEMRAYAYRYVFLTWGAFRLTKTVAPPLTVPGDLIASHSRLTEGIRKSESYKEGHLPYPSTTRTEITVSDFVFVHDALILAMYDDGIIVRVHGLEMTYATSLEQHPYQPLKYSVAKGISSPVNKLVGQYCCIKSEAGACPHGETVVAYREYSSDFRIYVSKNGGIQFQLITPSVPPSAVVLHSVLSYPDRERVLVLYGSNPNVAHLGAYSILSGASLASKSGSAENYSSISHHPIVTMRGIKGRLQAYRIGEEMSLLLWDQCRVWYSPDEGRNMTTALFYVHGFIMSNGSQTDEHYILPKYCKFGSNSTLAISDSGKLALLDSDNHFHLGVDTKNSSFKMAALKVDMSLILPKHQKSIVPHFDNSQHPKLLYPPRYLEQPSKGLLGSNYSQRLAIRLLPKTVFPSEFITVFYEENAHLPTKYKKFALKPCLTSSISVNKSITQKPRHYVLAPHRDERLNLEVRFKSKSKEFGTLHYEPEYVADFLNINVVLSSTVEVESEGQFWLTYVVTIQATPLAANNSRQIFRVNFFTSKTHRCNIQPSIAVTVILEADNSKSQVPNAKLLNPMDLTDSEMKKDSFIKMDPDHTEYGRSYQAEPKCGSQRTRNNKPSAQDFSWMS